ncbi:hypothetical protein SAMN04487887_11384 [Enterococcus casseliflavus]|uniref:hypothetical protein n=1 Tax=Enterococcus casseliflavus TaxID=37734 RepID=UPI0008E81468|nr:hypothetical protein [Enterococcus casseliflavus]SFE47944.1 hypothetical protein SAMN04487887_11384 [Enterococcus casseliflavus]
MERAFGYSQMRFNYITDYANSIAESAVQMEMVWQNRKNFRNDVDLEEWLKGQAEDIERKVSELSTYLRPLDAFYEKQEGSDVRIIQEKN